MHTELTFLWALVMLQMGALAVLARNVRQVRIRGVTAASPQGPSPSPQRPGDALDRSKLVAAAGRAPGQRWPSAYLFVSATCPACEDMLGRLRLPETGVPAALVAVGDAAAARRDFAERAERLGLTLFACVKPSELGIRQVPWLVTLDPEGRVATSVGAADPQVVANVLALQGDGLLPMAESLAPGSAARPSGGDLLR